ncbi:hypothetical protein HG530_006826 [Fusarium avenaceum]|nr:hypothetical protein HG530_006826 [Fusarium avenaceum]
MLYTFGSLEATYTGVIVKSHSSSRNRTIVVSSTVHVLRSIALQSVTVVAVAVRATTVRSPANLAGENSIGELGLAHGVVERAASVEGNVVVAPIPDSGVGHAVGREGKDGANDSTGENIVEVVVLVDGKSSTDQSRSEEGGVGGDQLPHGGVVVGEDLELGVEVQVKVDEASKGSSGVATGHGLKRIVDLILVTSADVRGVVELEVSLVVVSSHGASSLHVGLADGKEVRSETTDEPLDKDLEDGGGDEGVEKTDGGVVDIPEAADSDLHHEENEDGNKSSQHGGSPDGNDLSTERVSVLGPDNLTVAEGNREGSRRCRLSPVDLEDCQNAKRIGMFGCAATYTETNGTHNCHGENVEPCSLEPLPERRAARH